MALKRFTADIVVKHAELISSLFDALTETFDAASPIRSKWTTLKTLTQKRLDAKGAAQIFRAGLCH